MIRAPAVWIPRPHVPRRELRAFSQPEWVGAHVGLYLDIFETDPALYGVCKPPVAARHGAGDLRVDIFPGEPDQSILPFRMQSTAPGVAMPELGRQTEHFEALAVINAWIASLSGTCQ